jgi:hypothetical protein
MKGKKGNITLEMNLKKRERLRKTYEEEMERPGVPWDDVRGGDEKEGREKKGRQREKDEVI